MAASIDIVERNGVGGTATVKTSGTIRMKLADNATADSNNTLTVPTAGTNFSWQKYVQLYLNTAPSSSISNVRAYTTTANSPFGTGVTLYWKTTASYAQPVQESSAAAYTNLFGGTSSAAVYTSGSPLTISAGQVATGSSTAGVIGNMLVMCMTVDSTASVGTLTAANLTISYDEV